MADDEVAKKPVDLDGLGVVIDKIKSDYVRKENVPAMNFATREEILALFDENEATETTS